MNEYKIVINIPGEGISEVYINEDQLKALEPDIQAKRMVKIGGNYYNTAYVAKIVMDNAFPQLRKSENNLIPEKSEGTTKLENLERMADLKEKLKDQGVI